MTVIRSGMIISMMAACSPQCLRHAREQHTLRWAKERLRPAHLRWAGSDCDRHSPDAGQSAAKLHLTDPEKRDARAALGRGTDLRP